MFKKDLPTPSFKTPKEFKNWDKFCCKMWDSMPSTEKRLEFLSSLVVSNYYRKGLSSMAKPAEVVKSEEGFDVKLELEDFNPKKTMVLFHRAKGLLSRICWFLKKHGHYTVVIPGTNQPALIAGPDAVSFIFGKEGFEKAAKRLRLAWESTDKAEINTLESMSRQAAEEN